MSEIEGESLWRKRVASKCNQGASVCEEHGLVGAFASGADVERPELRGDGVETVGQVCHGRVCHLDSVGTGQCDGPSCSRAVVDESHGVRLQKVCHPEEPPLVGVGEFVAEAVVVASFAQHARDETVGKRRVDRKTAPDSRLLHAHERVCQQARYHFSFLGLRATTMPTMSNM